ncbi:immunity 70 family protein [Virgibacillus salinus]|uniref:Immunity protein 70 n=1 Tax=Virgibacillus salinus TaxID=553311 RepID=A0A1H0XWV2_9BACI|nr:immunity 70 family protein [Virgibacillus salinus]SDQ07349.1 Immunity protein 70 [Virgibacillus salinus]
MGIGINVGDFYYEIGSGDFFHSFFSTISYHLEPEGWGTKYPFLMNEFYQGSLKWDLSTKVIEELKDAHRRLQNYKPSQVVWDIEDTSLQPPWGDNISSDITSLANYFVTSDGEDLIEVLYNAFQTSYNEKENIEIG